MPQLMFSIFKIQNSNVLGAVWRVNTQNIKNENVKMSYEL